MRSPLSKKIAVGIVAVASLAATTLPHTRADAAATATIHSVTATSLACQSAAVAAMSQTQGNGATPICARNQWVYDLQAQNNAPLTRRTETHWGTASGTTQYHEGDTVTYEAEYAGYLGAAAQGDKDWHVIWQLHGPFGGTWRGPVMGLTVRNGELRLGGGAGHPSHDWGSRNHEWMYRLAAWEDYRPMNVKVQTYLSSDPAKGWVSVWIDGRLVLDQVRPTSYSGARRPGTYYPGLSYVASRTGLYRGTQIGAAPTYRQAVTARVVRTG